MIFLVHLSAHKGETLSWKPYDVFTLVSQSEMGHIFTDKHLLTKDSSKDCLRTVTVYSLDLNMGLIFPKCAITQYLGKKVMIVLISKMRKMAIELATNNGMLHKKE